MSSCFKLPRPTFIFHAIKSVLIIPALKGLSNNTNKIYLNKLGLVTNTRLFLFAYLKAIIFAEMCSLDWHLIWAAGLDSHLRTVLFPLCCDNTILLSYEWSLDVPRHICQSGECIWMSAQCTFSHVTTNKNKKRKTNETAKYKCASHPRGRETKPITMTTTTLAEKVCNEMEFRLSW